MKPKPKSKKRLIVSFVGTAKEMQLFLQQMKDWENIASEAHQRPEATYLG